MGLLRLFGLSSKKSQTEMDKQIIREEDISRAFPYAKVDNISKYYSGILLTLDKFEINTPERQAAFLSQCAHESANFSRVVENLNYSSDALRSVWPRQFPTKEIANSYHRKPELIANRAYANRMGNGPESSGDGWKYRGRGFIQITGKYNYRLCGDFLQMDLLSCPELLQEDPAAVLSAGWFWSINNLNILADQEDILSITRRINGGTHGLDDRKTKYSNAIKIFKNTGD